MLQVKPLYKLVRNPSSIHSAASNHSLSQINQETFEPAKNESMAFVDVNANMLSGRDETQILNSLRDSVMVGPTNQISNVFDVSKADILKCPDHLREIILKLLDFPMPPDGVKNIVKKELFSVDGNAGKEKGLVDNVCVKKFKREHEDESQDKEKTQALEDIFQGQNSAEVLFSIRKRKSEHTLLADDVVQGCGDITVDSISDALETALEGTICDIPSSKKKKKNSLSNCDEGESHICTSKNSNPNNSFTILCDLKNVKSEPMTDELNFLVLESNSYKNSSVRLRQNNDPDSNSCHNVFSNFGLNLEENVEWLTASTNNNSKQANERTTVTDQFLNLKNSLSSDSALFSSHGVDASSKIVKLESPVSDFKIERAEMSAEEGSQHSFSEAVLDELCEFLSQSKADSKNILHEVMNIPDVGIKELETEATTESFGESYGEVQDQFTTIQESLEETDPESFDIFGFECESTSSKGFEGIIKNQKNSVELCEHSSPEKENQFDKQCFHLAEKSDESSKSKAKSSKIKRNAFSTNRGKADCPLAETYQNTSIKKNYSATPKEKSRSKKEKQSFLQQNDLSTTPLNSKQHEILFDAAELSLTCNICDGKDNLKGHIISKLFKTSRQEAHSCVRVRNLNTNFTSRRSTNFKSSKNFTCALCHLTFKFQRVLKSHVLSVHL